MSCIHEVHAHTLLTVCHSHLARLPNDTAIPICAIPSSPSHLPVSFSLTIFLILGRLDSLFSSLLTLL